ncbi:MAG: hypothetical protein KFB93_08295 [Simkaniaceae bacterium]|nr:MAG: hypothetical protein KFB93_08295 [Simkaniaceae bacterium]
MKKSPHRMKHEQKKAIRQAQKEEYKTDEKVIKEEAKKKAVTSKRTNKIAKAKASSKKKSHKTSPDEVTWETEPESIHKEGAHWIKTIQKQTTDKAGRLRKKLQKLNFLKKKK